MTGQRAGAMPVSRWGKAECARQRRFIGRRL